MKVFFCLIILFTSLILGQDSLSIKSEEEGFFIVDSIKLSGNKITEPYVILEELTFKRGDTISRKDLDFNRERIYSLGIFTRVEIIPGYKDPLSDIHIKVEESWYIWPIPFVDLKDKDFKKVVFGMDVSINNFMGRNESLGLRFATGYDTELKIKYNVPYLLRKEKLFMNLELSYSKTTNKSIIATNILGKEFDQKVGIAQFALGKRIDLFDYLTTFAGFQYFETPEFVQSISLREGERIDRVFYLGLQYLYDSRDLAQFPLQGRWGLLNFVSKGLSLNTVNYNIMTVDYKEFWPVWNDLNIKWRLTSRHTFGNVIPYYEYSFLGYSDRVRGHYFEKTEGHTMVLSSVELRHPILKELNLQFDFPILPKELFTYRVAIYAQLFADAGLAKFRGEPFSLKAVQKGWGFGLTFLVLPYNLGRIEIAFDEDFRSQFILDVGVSF